MMVNSSIPSEDQEQATFVSYLRLKGLPHFHVPNSTYTKSWSQKRKNNRLGVVPGPPDLFIVVGGKLCAVEMKRKKGGVISPYQKEWIDILNNAGVETVVCRGSKEAIDFIKKKFDTIG